MALRQRFKAPEGFEGVGSGAVPDVDLGERRGAEEDGEIERGAGVGVGVATRKCN